MSENDEIKIKFKELIINVLGYEWDIVSKKLNDDPELLKQKNKSDCVLLQILIHINAPKDIILNALDKYPEGAQQINKYGKMPLHTALGKHSDPEIIKAVLDKYPLAARHKDNDDNLPLYLVLGENLNQSELILEILKAYPEATQIKYRYDCLPLHIAIINDIDLEIVKELININPDALRLKDGLGNFPLHLAISFCKSLELINVILPEYPEAATFFNNDGNLPLHLLSWKDWNQYPIKILFDVLNAYPNAALKNCSYGHYPLHSLLNNNVPIEVLNEFIKICPESLNLFEKGQLPLHLSIEKRLKQEVILTIFNNYPEATSIKNYLGEYPFNSILHNELTKETPDLTPIPPDNVAFEIYQAFPGVVDTITQPKYKEKAFDLLYPFRVNEVITVTNFNGDNYIIKDWINKDNIKYKTLKTTLIEQHPELKPDKFYLITNDNEDPVDNLTLEKIFFDLSIQFILVWNE